MKEFKCKDAGHACEWKAKANDEREVVRQVKEHGRVAHGMRDEDLKDEKIKPLIHDVA